MIQNRETVQMGKRNLGRPVTRWTLGGQLAATGMMEAQDREA